MTKKALITGITGQDGSYLAELLFGKRYEVDVLIGDSSKAQKKLGWKPKVRFKELVRIMVGADLEKEKLLLGGSSNYKRENNHAVP